MKQPIALDTCTKTETHDFEKNLTTDVSIDSTNKELKLLLKRISSDLQTLRREHEENEKNELILLKWKYATIILDRFFLF